MLKSNVIPYLDLVEADSVGITVVCTVGAFIDKWSLGGGGGWLGSSSGDDDLFLL